MTEQVKSVIESYFLLTADTLTTDPAPFWNSPSTLISNLPKPQPSIESILHGK